MLEKTSAAGRTKDDGDDGANGTQGGNTDSLANTSGEEESMGNPRDTEASHTGAEVRENKGDHVPCAGRNGTKRRFVPLVLIGGRGKRKSLFLLLIPYNLLGY